MTIMSLRWRKARRGHTLRPGMYMWKSSKRVRDPAKFRLIVVVKITERGYYTDFGDRIYEVGETAYFCDGTEIIYEHRGWYASLPQVMGQIHEKVRCG